MPRATPRTTYRCLLPVAARTVLGALALAAATLVAAQGTFPERSIRVVVPQPAGGAGDTVTRIVAQRLAVRLGTPVVVENRAGAGGTLGTAIVAKAPADGYTLVFASTGYATFQAMYPKLTFDPATDLAPLAMIGSVPFLFLVRNDAPFRSVAEMIAFAKAQPGKLNYATAGNGSLSHLLSAWLMAEAGIQMTHIPFSGTAPALGALLGGQVDMAFDPITTSAALVAAGKARALAVSGGARARGTPNIPTLVESGYPVRGAVWLALMLPAGVPAPISARLNREINAVLQEPEVRAQLQSRDIDIDAQTPEQFSAFLASEIRTWGKIVRDIGIKAE